MGRAFHAHVAPPWPFDDLAFGATIETVAAQGFVAMSGGGFIAGLLSAHPFSPAWPVARELLWWAQDGRGMALLTAFRDWATDQGAREVQWSCPPDARARQIFARRGPETEIVFSEILPCASPQF